MRNACSPCGGIICQQRRGVHAQFHSRRRLALARAAPIHPRRI